MEVVAIAIMGKNRVIGDGSDQPLKIREDWDRFKATTMGHPMIMGRATHEAIGRFLPGRTTIVVSRAPNKIEVTDNSFAVGSVELALTLAEQLDQDVAFICGGGQIYRAAMPYIDRVLLTEVDAEPEGDVTFPVLEGFCETERVSREGFAFVTYERVS